MASPRKALVIGMSHVEAVSCNLTPELENKISICALNSEKKVYDIKRNRLNLKSIKPKGLSDVFISLGGNFHTIFGLIENPVPFAVTSKTLRSDVELTKRWNIPFSVMKQHFARHVERVLGHIDPIAEHFAGSNLHMLCSPPPIQDDQHILANPGIFRPRLHLGITPKSVRLALYQMHTEIYHERSKALGINFIQPPIEAVDPKGFLGDAYVNNDPTHGNAKYGELVLRQILEILEN